VKRPSVRSWGLLFLVVATFLGACGGSRPPASSAATDPLVVGSGDAPPAPPPGPTAAPEDDAALPIFADDAVRGSRLAPVTVVVFSDLECPYCARLDKTLDELQKAYGDEKLRIVFKNFPLTSHVYARLAAEVGQGVLEIAGPKAFWRYKSKAFQHQDEISPDALRAWAVEAGADAHSLEEGLAAKRWVSKVGRDLELARRLEINAAPTSFVNGVPVMGAQSSESFEKIIDGELAEARTLVASGVSPDKVYARRVAANLEQPEGVDEGSSEPLALAESRLVHKIPVGKGPVRGPDTAYVTIVVFSDFQCPFCKRATETLARIQREYGDKVRIVWRDMPLSFHERAEPAAELARAARAQKGDAGFWAVHDLLFDSQPSLDDADLERIAREAKLDVAKAMASVRSRAFRRVIDEDVALGEEFAVTGTPQFFLNGRRVSGAKPFDLFKTIIDEEIAKADALVRGGASAKNVYDLLVKDGQTPPEPEKRSIAAAPASAPFRGAANGKVVIQMVGDFRSASCRRADATISDLIKAYPGKIKVVWRDMPGPSPAGILAAEAAREAFAQKGSAGFEKMSKALFEHRQALRRDDVDGFAKAIGLDMTRFERALDDRKHKADVDADVRAARDASVRIAPTFFVGPYYVAGTASYARLAKLVELVLAGGPAGAPAAKGAAP